MGEIVAIGITILRLMLTKLGESLRGKTRDQVHAKEHEVKVVLSRGNLSQALISWRQRIAAMSS